MQLRHDPRNKLQQYPKPHLNQEVFGFRHGQWFICLFSPRSLGRHNNNNNNNKDDNDISYVKFHFSLGYMLKSGLSFFFALHSINKKSWKIILGHGKQYLQRASHVLDQPPPTQDASHHQNHYILLGLAFIYYDCIVGGSNPSYIYTRRIHGTGTVHIPTFKIKIHHSCR